MAGLITADDCAEKLDRAALERLLPGLDSMGLNDELSWCSGGLNGKAICAPMLPPIPIPMPMPSPKPDGDTLLDWGSMMPRLAMSWLVGEGKFTGEDVMAASVLAKAAAADEVDDEAIMPPCIIIPFMPCCCIMCCAEPGGDRWLKLAAAAAEKR